MPIEPGMVVGVVGAGAMGTGIAQVAAVAGHRVVLADTRDGAAARARTSIAAVMEREVNKGRTVRDAADAALARIDPCVIPSDPSVLIEAKDRPLAVFQQCGLVIEAIVEDLATKQTLFRALAETLSADAVLATNTSSLSVASVASGCVAPERVIGIHFFNPAPVLPLVEIVPWLGTSPAVTDAAYELMQRWKKVPVRASDTPGFIVNRIARPFYGESIRMLEEGVANIATIDWALKELAGFRMGPFELMDFIGNDVNYAVTRSVFEGMFYDPRYRPSLTQRRLVEAGLLGKKSGRGYYDYRDGAVQPHADKNAHAGLLIVERVLAMLINEAIDAVFLRIASPDDIDLALTKGVNYPKGLLAWANELGLPRVLGWMERLQSEYGEDRYRPSPLLRRMVREERQFFQ